MKVKNGEGLTQDECARRLGVSREYVHQVEKRAIKKLRAIIRQFPYLTPELK